MVGERLYIAVPAGAPRKMVSALRFGTWCIHASINGEGFVVSDTQTGRSFPTSMVDGLELHEAAIVAVHLDRRFGSMPKMDHDDWQDNPAARLLKHVLDALIAEALEGVDCGK